MKYQFIYTIACMIYKQVLRDLLIKAIDDPSTDWDNVVIEICDRIFNYGG